MSLSGFPFYLLATEDVTNPVITSSNTLTVAENEAFSHTLTANEAVTWSKIGGADQALFTLTGNSLTMTAKDFENPVDADTNNTYIVQVRATDGASNTTDQTITVTVTDVNERVTGPLSDVIASVVFDVDSTLEDSYDGTDTFWRNLIASPADGETQATYDFRLGSADGSDTADPTFVGTAGTTGAHFTNDGSDYFQLAANTTLTANLHQAASTQDWWMCFAFYLDSTGTFGYLTRTRGGGNGISLAAFAGSDRRTQFIQNNTGGSTGALPTDRFTANAYNVLVISRDASTGDITWWINEVASPQTTNVTYTSGTAAADFAMRLFDAGMANNDLFHVSMGNEYLDDTKVAAIVGRLEARHERDYTP